VCPTIPQMYVSLHRSLPRPQLPLPAPVLARGGANGVAGWAGLAGMRSLKM
jgi:hypothetical protein